MAATAATPEIAGGTEFRTVADLLKRLGESEIAPDRVRLDPAPGTATAKDVERIYDREKRRCELIDGILVEKAEMGYEEATIALYLGAFLIDFLRQNKLGRVAGADGAVQLSQTRIRFPDLSFVTWDRLPKKMKPIPDLVPDLVVEVFSKSNTKKEMARKLVEYFRAGVRLVWYVDPRKRTIVAYTAPDRSTTLGESDTLDGGDVLPGFALPIAELFAEALRESPE